MKLNYLNYKIRAIDIGKKIFFANYLQSEKCARLGCYEASSGNSYRHFGITYRYHLQGSRIQSFKNL